MSPVLFRLCSSLSNTKLFEFDQGGKETQTLMVIIIKFPIFLISFFLIYLFSLEVTTQAHTLSPHFLFCQTNNFSYTHTHTFKDSWYTKVLSRCGVFNYLLKCTFLEYSEEIKIIDNYFLRNTHTHTLCEWQLSCFRLRYRTCERLQFFILTQRNYFFIIHIKRKQTKERKRRWKSKALAKAVTDTSMRNVTNFKE